MIKPQKIEDAWLVTHQGCLDGSGCAIMHIAAGGREDRIRYVSAGRVEQFVKTDPLFWGDDFIIFADVGLNRPEYADLLEKRGNCVIIDHHKTSLHLKGRKWCTIDMDACGTELYRRYLVQHGFMKELDGDARRKLSLMIDDHDRWIRNDPRSSDLAMLMSFLGQNRFIQRFRRPWVRFVDEHFWRADEQELISILREKRRDSIARGLNRVHVKDVCIPAFFRHSIKIAYVVSSEPNVSLLLDTVLSSHPEAQMAACVDFDRNSVSLRSRSDFDVAEFASIFGGGGHRQASGHPIPFDAVEELLDALHVR